MKRLSVILLVFIIIMLISWTTLFNEGSEQQELYKQDKGTASVTHLKFGHNIPVDSALHEASIRFSNLVKERTNGQISITVYPAQELGNDHKMVELARKGDIDIILTPTAKMSVAVPSMQYADLPFYFPSREDLYNMLDGEPGKMIMNDLKKIDLIGVTFWENGFKHFTANSPILSPDDFIGKKIRIMKSRILIEQFQSFGAEPIPIDFHSTRKALADKIVDGQENPLVAIESMGFHEVQSDLTLSEHAYLGYVLSFSEKNFSKLPQNIRHILIQTAQEITPWERAQTQKREAQLLEKIKKSGISIHTLTDTQRQEFAKLTAHIPQKYEDIIGSHIISKTTELLHDKYEAIEDHILIGVNADISLGGKVAGLAIKRGVDIAVEEINNNGGILGQSVEVIVKDHRALASKGIQNVLDLNKNDNLVAIIGGMHSAVVSAEMETIQKQQIPYIIPWAAATEIVDNGYKNNYVFRVSANDKLASEFIAQYTIKKHSKPAIIVENSIWGRNNLELMKKYFIKHNISYAEEIIFNRGQTNFKEDILKIMKSKPDSIIMVANPIEGSEIVNEIYNVNKALPIISHWGITGGDFFKKNKHIIQDMQLHFFQTFSFNDNDRKKSQHLLNTYLRKYQHSNSANVKASSGVAQAYDAVYLLATAIQEANSTKRPKIKEALENLPNYSGVIKDYNPAFSLQKHDALDSKNYFMAKYNEDGIIVPVQ